LLWRQSQRGELIGLVKPRLHWRAVLPLRVSLLAVLAVLVAAGCGGGSKAVPADAAAVVGGQVVPKWRVEALLDEARAAYTRQQKSFPTPGSRQYDALKQRATAFLVVGAMYIDRAQEDGITVGDADVDAALARSREAQYGGSLQQQAAAWKTQGISPREAREEQRLQLTEQRVERKLLNNIEIAPGDLEAFYEDNKTRFSVPESREIRMILVRSLPLAQQIESELHAGASFVDLVRRYSQDAQTKANKGVLVVARGQGGDAFEQAAFGLKVGGISQPVTSPDGGIRIITPLGPIRPRKYTPLSEVKDVLRMQVVEQKRQSVVADWQKRVKADYCGKKVTYAKGYTPTGDADPCGENRVVPSTG
jgi:parvulin-like peptidyl-prolyl isomerase